MENELQKQHTNFDSLSSRINDLENRLIKIEKAFARPGEIGIVRDHTTTESHEITDSQTSYGQHESVESRIGEYGMAWLGNIVLLFGILFLTQFLQKNGQEAFSVLLGLILVAGIYVAGRYSKISLPYLSRLFTYNGHIMLFIISMRIYLFQGSRIIENIWVGHGVVLLVVVTLIFLSFRNKSQVLAVLVWIMAVITALYSNSTHMMLLITVGVTGSSIFFASRNNWWIGLVISIFLVYITFLIWIMGINGMVMTRDLFNLFIFVEITAVASFVLVAMERDAIALSAGFKYVIAGTMASLTWENEVG